MLARAEAQPEQRKEAYLQIKGGTHIGIAIGLSILALVITFGVGAGLSYLPTKQILKMWFATATKQLRLKRTTIIQNGPILKRRPSSRCTIYRLRLYRKEHVRIVFNVYLDKQIYEWDKIYINGKS